MNDLDLHGSCLCGAVSYEISGNARLFWHCHCSRCRKASGTGHGSHMIVAEADFTFSGEIKFFDKPADSGNRVSRGFCPHCGSALYSTNSGMPGLVFVRASSLDDPEHFKPQMVVYTDRAASWDVMDTRLPGFARMPTPEDLP